MPAIRTVGICSMLLVMLSASAVCTESAFAQSRPDTVAPADLRTDPRASSAATVLPLRRDIPEPVPGSCPAAPVADAPVGSVEDRQEAARLATEASNAAILGDLATARDLLARASSLDALDPDLAFRYARTLEELGEVAGAVSEYCRYLIVAPNAPDAAEVTALVTRIAPPVRVGIPDDAVDNFRTALALVDSGRLAEAEHTFTAVIGAAPGWAAPWYNRGLVRTQARQRGAAREDFTTFLSLEPESPARAQVVEWVAQLDAPRTRYSPGTAFAAGLIPGVGHFYTGRPATGVLFLATAGGAAAAGFLIETRRVECLGNPQGGVCPPDQIRNERVEQPYLIVGLGVAAAATVLGAFDAARGARSRNAQEPIIRFGSTADRGRASVLFPAVQSTRSRLDLAMIRLQF